MPPFWLITEYDEPSACAAYDRVPLWLICADRAPLRTEARPADVWAAGSVVGSAPDAEVTLTTPTAAAPSTSTVPPTKRNRRRPRPDARWWGAGASGARSFTSV